MQIDYSKGLSLHNLYGHYVFAMEAEKAGKSAQFVTNICAAAKCTGKSNDWRNQLEVSKL